MGKGFNNYMCKKFFHPASRDNLKRVWMAEQKTEAYKKKQEELRVQYEKEQDLYNNKALLWKDSKEKLSLNFMYDPPPGLVKDKQGEDEPIELESKFEWQRKFNAPREDYCKGDSAIRDQPFGIRVRNVRCIRCHNMGHLNTDRECPLFHKSVEGEIIGGMDTSFLLKQMQDDGLTIKPSLLRPDANLCKVDYNLDERYKEYEDELQFIRTLPREDKIMLLKALRKIRKKEKKGEKAKIEKIAKRLKKEAERKCEEKEIKKKTEEEKASKQENERKGRKEYEKEKEREIERERKQRKEYEKEKENERERKKERERENERKQRKEYGKEKESERERENDKKQRKEYEKEKENDRKRRKEHENEKENEEMHERKRRKECEKEKVNKEKRREENNEKPRDKKGERKNKR